MQKNIVHGNITAKGNVHVGDIINQVLPQSEPELTQEWFRNQVTLAVADLHERYSPKEHFDLPIARMFSGLARDDEFQSLVRNYFHEFLKETKENSDRLKRRTEVAAYLPILNNSRAAIREFYEKTKWQAGNPLDLSPLLAVLTNLIAATSKMEEELWEKRREIWQQQTPEKRKYDREPFSDELYYLRKIDTATDDFQAQMESEILQLAVNPCLLLHGKAGNGKSHLLGDTSSKRINQGLPAVLILGNKLISKSPVWQQILDEIGLNCSSESFLKHLNEAGRQAGTRALLMIDALNEGEGKNFWKNHLAGFIHEVRKYSFIGLVLTVRDTYLKSVVPQTIVDSPDVVKVEHRGFEGYELEAVKHFCHYFELEQPRFPILSPEFANPQLLLLLCKTLQKSGRKSLPEGLNGITAIYESYLEAVNITLAARLGYPEGNNLVRKGLEHLAVALAKAGANRLEYSEVERIFSSFNSEKGWDILQELLYQEGILAEDRISDYQTDSTRDVVRFGYERFGDFVIASHLLDTHVKKDTPATAFRGKGFFVDFFNPDNLYWRSGILEAVAVLLPERFGLEIVEVFTEKKMKSDDRRFEDEVVFAWLAGLIWRKKESIDLKKFMSLARKWVRYEGLVNIFQSIQLSLSIVPEHPLNADRLHSALMNLSMAERDSRWSPFIHSGMSEEESAIRRITDWIWREDDLGKMPDETVRLTATLLSWCFISSNRHLRDLATLSAVRLFDERSDILLTWLRQFEGVNDPYVHERLFAVALGVTLRMNDRAGIARIAQYVYDQIFRDGEPPVHILLRDYARTTVEYALHLGLSVVVDVSLLRPPYKSKMPTFPNEKEVKKYEVDYKSEEFQKDKRTYGAQGSIVHSVLGWDFNRYVIDPHVDDFYQVSFTRKKQVDEFRKALPKNAKPLFKLLEACHVLANSSPDVRSNMVRLLGAKESADFEAEMKSRVEKCTKELISVLDKEQGEAFSKVVIPHLDSVARQRSRQYRKMDHQPIARWILQRVFELGWRRDWHGEFDDRVDRFSDLGRDPSSGRTERIGKKYQWIAFHEIMARLADNHFLSEYGEKPRPYQGTWNPFVRDIDPTFPFLHPDYSPVEKQKTESAWWQPVAYNNWHHPDWIMLKEDLPDPAKLTEVVDPHGETWLALINFPDWEEEKPFGESDEGVSERRLWYHIRAYLIREKDESKAMKWLPNQRFYNETLPDQRWYYELFEREMYWSPAYVAFKERSKKEGYKLWQKPENRLFSVVVPAEEYEGGGGGFGLQGNRILKPHSFLWEKMRLQHSKRPGEFLDKVGKVVLQDPAAVISERSCLLVRKDAFLTFLQENKLKVFWTLLGEKQVLRPMPTTDQAHLREIHGVMRLSSTDSLELASLRCESWRN